MSRRGALPCSGAHTVSYISAVKNMPGVLTRLLCSGGAPTCAQGNCPMARSWHVVVLTAYLFPRLENRECQSLGPFPGLPLSSQEAGSLLFPHSHPCQSRVHCPHPCSGPRSHWWGVRHAPCSTWVSPSSSSWPPPPPTHCFPGTQVLSAAAACIGTNGSSALAEPRKWDR